MFAEHISDQQFANELPIQLGIQPNLPGIEHHLEHILKSHDGIVKKSVKETKGEFRRNDEQLSRLRMFQVGLQMLDECIKSLVGIGTIPHRLDQTAMKAFTLMPDERVEQLILCGKVAIERAPRYAGRFAHIENGHTMHTGSQHDVLGGSENRGNGGFGTTATPTSPDRARSGCRRRRGGALARLPSGRRRCARLDSGLGSGAFLA